MLYDCGLNESSSVKKVMREAALAVHNLQYQCASNAILFSQQNHSSNNHTHSCVPVQKYLQVFAS